MSLEAAIEKNTVALNQLLAALSGAQLPAAATAPAAKDPVAKTAAPAPAATQPAPTAGKQDTPTYEDAKRAILELSKAKGRDAAIKALGTVGATKLPEVKPEQFGALIGACREALEAVTA